MNLNGFVIKKTNMAEAEDYLPIDKTESGELITEYLIIMENFIEIIAWCVFLVALVIFFKTLRTIKAPKYWSLETERKTY